MEKKVNAFCLSIFVHRIKITIFHRSYFYSVSSESTFCPPNLLWQHIPQPHSFLDTDPQTWGHPKLHFSQWKAGCRWSACVLLRCCKEKLNPVNGVRAGFAWLFGRTSKPRVHFTRLLLLLQSYSREWWKGSWPTLKSMISFYSRVHCDDYVHNVETNLPCWKMS